MIKIQILVTKKVLLPSKEQEELVPTNFMYSSKKKNYIKKKETTKIYLTNENRYHIQRGEELYTAMTCKLIGTLPQKSIVTTLPTDMFFLILLIFHQPTEIRKAKDTIHLVFFCHLHWPHEFIYTTN